MITSMTHYGIRFGLSQTKPKMKYLSKILPLLVFYVLISCSEEPIHPKRSTAIRADDEYVPNEEKDIVNGRSSAENMTMGNPSSATSSTSTYWNYLITKTQYSMSYHRDRGTPNWVSWHLDN